MLAAMIDDGPAIHYSAVARGTPVYSSDEVEIGKREGGGSRCRVPACVH